jgi:hypothetical protein
VKKTLALIGAGALGITAGAAGALPAVADATVDCQDLNEHTITTAEDPGNWFMDCVPQYGLGKAEFTIVPNLDDPTEEFPAGFADLTEMPPVEYSSTADLEAMNEYFGEFPVGSGLTPITPVELVEEAPTSQTWAGLVIAPVAGVAAVTDENVPAAVAEACGLGDTVYGGGWTASFGAVDTTFSQVVDGETWTFTVAGTPLPVYYFGTIVVADGFATISETDPWCVSDGFGTFGTESTGDIPLEAMEVLFYLVYHGVPAGLDELNVNSLGSFGRFEAVAPAPAPAPALAATGAGDPLSPMVAGGVLALLGTALVAATGIVRRRKQA